MSGYNIMGDDFGYGFMIYNGWLIFSLYLVIVQVLPIWKTVQNILVFPANIRVRLGSEVKLQLSHIALFVNSIFILVLYLTIQSFQDPGVKESPTLKNIRLSKKWQNETYLYQAYLSFACWLYSTAFGSLNDLKSDLEKEINKLEKGAHKRVRRSREDRAMRDKVIPKEKEKTAIKGNKKNN